MATPIYEIRRVARIRLIEAYTLITPGAPLVSPQGITGATTWAYAIVANNATGSSPASSTKTITNGNATLDGSNYNQLTWQAVQGATSYSIYRITAGGTPSTTGLIGSSATTTFNDQGAAGNSATAPTENTSGVTDPFWSDADLTDLIIKGCKELWRAIIDLHRNHFITIDDTNVSLASGATSLTGVPADCFRVLSLEPRDLTEVGAFRNVSFRPRPYQSQVFQRMRSLGSRSPTEFEILYDIINAGSPVAAPSIVVAPASSSTIPLRLVYVKTLSSALNEDSDNPIPGESDDALVAWCVAHARADEREDRSPDPNWLAKYATEKQNILTALTPRQEQEIEVVEDVFGSSWYGGGSW